MSFLYALGQYVSVFAFWCWYLFENWLYLFISPLQHFETLWIIIPIYLTWFANEAFQEKYRTNFGNAVSNGVLPVWAALDWSRYLVGQVQYRHLAIDSIIIFKFAICGFVFLYGMTIIVFGIRGKRFVPYVGRARDIAYVLLVFTPVIYGAVYFTFNYLLGIILFFPLFYWLIEFIDRHTPRPKVFDLDKE